ncbi:MAG: hybrid sensor histidine kinase/response regulator [Anaerolineae bacterium]
MGLSSEIRKQLVNTFKTEQSEHVQKITQGLLALEKEPARADRLALLNEIFREAHSLKGAARAIGLATIESLGHGLEDALLKVKEDRLAFSAELFDLLYQTLDAIELMMARLEAGDSTPPAKVLALLAHLEESVAGDGEAKQRGGEEAEEPGSNLAREASPGVEEIHVRQNTGSNLALENNSPQPPTSTRNVQSPREASNLQSDETIRVSVIKLDTLMAQVSELVGAKIRAEQRLTEVRQLQMALADEYKEGMSFRYTYRRLPHAGRNGTHQPQPGAGLKLQTADLGDFVARYQGQLRLLNTQVNELYRQFTNDTMRLSLIINELQEEIKRVRMQPLATITAMFERMVRDLAHQQEKQISLTITGGETELDKRVLERVKDPLIHLLRNAVDHGLETATQRQQAGKSTTGQIQISASQQGSNVIITVNDDGRGLDLTAIRQAAVRKGLASKSEVEKLNDVEAAMLIFSSGLSTNRIITDISGRGVGLDVVRQNIEELQGTLSVASTPGQGVKFSMTLPLTLASSRGLLVQVGEQIFALPLSTVERMLQIERKTIAMAEGKEVITYQGQPVALVWLEDVLEMPLSAKEATQLTVVIVAVAEKRLGLVVDSLIEEQEIVIKNLGRQLARVGGIAGATILGSGQVILVLHPADLIKLAGRVQRRLPAEGETKRRSQPQRKMVLVVDDSITTRTLEKNILEAAGYQVRVATNGEEALSLLATAEPPHLIVTDINMPKVDGFELTSRVRQDRRLAHLPVVLVTSLDSPADKARGIEVGADAYIVKSRFDQSNLLETIEQLV